MTRSPHVHVPPKAVLPPYDVSRTVSPTQAVSPRCSPLRMPTHPSYTPTTPPAQPCPPWHPGQLCPPHCPPTAHLEGLPSEVAGAELALDPALGAAVLDVLGEVTAAQFGAAAVGAGDHIEATDAKMGLEGTGMVMGKPQGRTLPLPPPPKSYLEVLDEPAPAAALLAVDAADGQAQHLRLQLGVGVDLQGQQWGISILHRAVGAHSPQHSLAGSLGHAARGRIPPGHTNKLPLSGAGFRSPAPRHKGLLLPPGRPCQAGAAVPGAVRSLGTAPWRGCSLGAGYPSVCQAHLGVVQGQLVLRALEDAFAVRHKGLAVTRGWRAA